MVRVSHVSGVYRAIALGDRYGERRRTLLLSLARALWTLFDCLVVRRTSFIVLRPSCACTWTCRTWTRTPAVDMYVDVDVDEDVDVDVDVDL